MQKFKVSELIPHAQNEFFFDDMECQKWKEFLESVRTSGVIEPPVVANEGVIVSGHQRIRACKELGIDEIFCEVRIYDDPDKMTKDLIETNVRQRGTIGGSDLKMGRIIKELERIYGVKRGGDKRANPHCADLKSQADIAKELGMSVDVMNRLKKLSDLPEEFQEMLESGSINAKTGYTLIAKLSEEEQIALLEKLPSAQKFTQAQMQQYIDQIKGLEQEKQELQEEAVEAVKMAKGAAEASDDSAEYLRMKEAKETAEEERRRYYEKWKEEEKKSKGLSADEVQKKVDEAVAKTKQEYRKLVDSQEKTIAELQDQEPETVEVEVEVIPDDYKQTKEELATVKEELARLLANQSRPDKTARVLTIDETPEDRARFYFNSMQNSTGGFLSDMEGFALQKEFCLPLPADKKAFIAENLRTIINRCEEIITFVKDCNKMEVA